MRKRGQKVTLKHINTGKVVKTKIILADSKQGYLAELIDKLTSVSLMPGNGIIQNYGRK